MSQTLNDILAKIDEYRERRGWTLYRLAKESGMQYSSLHSMFEKNTQPTIPTLTKLCKGLGISLEKFFSEEMVTNFNHCTEDELELLNAYRSMNKQDKKFIQELSKRFSQE